MENSRASEEHPPRKAWPVTLIFGVAAVAILAGIIFIFRLTSAPAIETTAKTRHNALADSSDSCVTCHEKSSPGIVVQYGSSSMAAARVTCRDCHEVKEGYPGSVEHEGTHVLNSPTTATCEKCHQSQVAQYNQSRHSLPAYVAVAGSQSLSPELLAAYQAIPEGTFAPDKARNILAEMEGPEITRFACESCHNIGRPAADGSVGRCQSCHIRHEFSLEQARKPETCNFCHIGPDHPQWEIYHESPHGIAYSTLGHTWNWEADTGTLTSEDFPAPTCATCHFSGFGGAATTHDTGDRLTWYLFSSVSERRPAWQDNKARMQSVCFECHNQNFIDNLYTDADVLTEKVNMWVRESDEVIQPLKDQGLITETQFDEPLEYEHYELWHHWGRTTKFGAWMQGPDYTQWHGAYEVVKGLATLRYDTAELLHAAAQLAPAE
ncbi:MAG: nitrate reductase [Leptolinea sp.]|nr:nitrate reductase [Leptolinea sp.]